jgi:hypothetical protein
MIKMIIHPATDLKSKETSCCCAILVGWIKSGAQATERPWPLIRNGLSI